MVGVSSLELRQVYHIRPRIANRNIAQSCVPVFVQYDESGPLCKMHKNRRSHLCKVTKIKFVQSAQFREPGDLKVCANLLLTKWQEVWYNGFLARDLRSRATRKDGLIWPTPQSIHHSERR